MPALFVGHGSPMNALADNKYTQAWRALAESMPKPKAILAISAHWYTRGTAITVNAKQRTIHDFYGFPPDLYAIQYSPSGDPELAARIQTALAPLSVVADRSWGLDHGTWSVLLHMYPQIDIPVLQLSIDGAQDADFHYRIGEKLRGLRAEGVLLFGSGNVVHNLRAMLRTFDAPPYDWAIAFNDYVRDNVVNRNHAALIHFERAGNVAQLSLPSPEHYLPLLYILGAQSDDETATIPCDGIDMASTSMLSVKIGG